MECIPAMRARENFWRLAVERSLVRAQKSSTNASRRLIVKAAVCKRASVFAFSSILCSNRWCGSDVVDWRR